MTMTGPQYYPGANTTTSWFEGRYGGDKMDVNVLVIHTTEGRNLPDYQGGAVAPNITLVPDFKAQKLRPYQHYRIDVSSRALVNKLGGVATNTNNVTQVELVGTCDPSTSGKWAKAGYDHIYWPAAPGWALMELAKFVAWLHKEHGIPLVIPSKWPAYPGSYGVGASQRLSFDAWNKFRGVCGHMHVPENSHGDPGAINITRVMDLAKQILGIDPPAPGGGGGSTPPPTIPPFPGQKYFGSGANNAYVTQLGKQLVKKGFGKHYTSGPGPKWSDADRANVRDFQLSRAELRGMPDGIPGPLTWKLLFS